MYLKSIPKIGGVTVIDETMIKPNLEISQMCVDIKPIGDQNNPMYIGEYKRRPIYNILIEFSLSLIPENVVISNATFIVFLTMEQEEHNIFLYNRQNGQYNMEFPSNIPIKKRKLEQFNLIEYTFDIRDIVEKQRQSSMKVSFVLKAEDQYGNEKSSFYKPLFPNAMICYRKVLREEETKNMIEEANIDAQENKLEAASIGTSSYTKIITFYNEEETLEISGLSPSYSSVYDTSQVRIGTFFIKNTGDHSISAGLEISPDGVDFIQDQSGVLIEPGQKIVILPYHFGRYTRVFAHYLEPQEEPSTIKIWYQYQKYY